MNENGFVALSMVFTALWAWALWAVGLMEANLLYFAGAFLGGLILFNLLARWVFGH
jgi:uncharacterized YccA/Bax inhibitor family protein